MNTKTLEQEIEELKVELAERDETITELNAEIKALEKNVEISKARLWNSKIS